MVNSVPVDSFPRYEQSSALPIRLVNYARHSVLRLGIHWYACVRHPDGYIWRFAGASGFIGWLLPMLLGLLLAMHAAPTEAASQRYQSDDWVAECEGGGGSPECSIMVPFRKSENGQAGSFTLAVVLSTGDLAIVGQPEPLRAVLRIDGNPPIECREPGRCLFRRDQALLAIDQLGRASLVLIDVMTEKRTYRFSLTARGYRAGLAQIRAWNPVH